MRGKCAAIAPVTVQAAAKVKASSIIGRSIGICGFTALATAALAPCTAGSMKKLMGSPSRMCAAAQAKQVLRQPICSSPSAVSGQPTVEAKPAISVMPVIERRAASP